MPTPETAPVGSSGARARGSAPDARAPTRAPPRAQLEFHLRMSDYHAAWALGAGLAAVLHPIDPYSLRWRSQDLKVQLPPASRGTALAEPPPSATGPCGRCLSRKRAFHKP